MLLSITLILITGFLLGELCKKVHIPSLFGMIIAGIVIGPHMLNLIDNSILAISSELRKIALIIILIRAGLKLSVDDLKKVGRPAILMCFVPATFEMCAMALFAPKLLGMPILDALILGAVIAAVSPAVIVPKMIKLIDEGYGTKQSIPQMILAGASVDDVYVIVMFTTFLGLAQGGDISFIKFVNIPISIITGILGGFLAGLILVWIFGKTHLRMTVKIMLILCLSFALVAFEDGFKEVIPFASLIAVMAMGLNIRQKQDELAGQLSVRFDSMWVIAEIFLFVLVGASVAVENLFLAGIKVIVLLACVMVMRMIGVFVCLIGTKLTNKEKIFCMLAYTPKATVQAAIGGIPLSMGLASGDMILTVSVVAILLTAPLGAFAIDLTYRKFLQH